VVKSLRHPVKILGDGELSHGLTVHAHAFSRRAAELIQAAGGTVVVIGGEPEPEPPRKRRAKPAAAPEPEAEAAPAADDAPAAEAAEADSSDEAAEPEE
jgi:hypothetical protein